MSFKESQDVMSRLAEITQDFSIEEVDPAIESKIYNIESFENYSFTQRSKQNYSKFKAMQTTFLFMLALTLIAFFTACVAIFIDVVAYNMIKYKKVLVFMIENPYLGCFIWVLISIIFICFATSFGYFIAPEIDGSGIPEVKGILSGVELPKYLSMKTLICKIFGLICCSGSLSIGKEGPHVHLAAIVAYRVLKMKIFEPLNEHPGVRTRIMESSVAAGVAAVMAAPLGSVFFSMELTATFYMIHNVYLALYCGVLSAFFLEWYRLLNLTEVISNTNIPEGFNNYDLILFSFIGIASGIIGVLFTSLTKFLVISRSKKKIPWLHRRFRYAIFMTTAYSTICYVFPFMMLNAKQVFNQLFVNGELGNTWTYFGIAGSLGVFISLKILFTATSTSVQIPGGVFLPVLICGAAFGRLVHMISSSFGGVASASMYAAVAGGAFISSTCHSLSVGLIIFEMTGQIHYVVPMLLAVIISYSIGCSLGLNIYDAMIIVKKIPYLPAIRKTKLYNTSAYEIMEESAFVLQNCTYRQLRDASYNKNAHKVAIVDENHYVLADFNIKLIQKYLMKCLDSFSDVLRKDQRAEIENCMRNEKSEISPSSMPKLRRFSSVDAVESFWDLPVDFTDRIFKINKHPMVVQENTSLVKIHYLFLMLGLMQLYVTKEFKLVGVIYRHYFTKSNK